jgi:hypothetical protein
MGTRTGTSEMTLKASPPLIEEHTIAMKLNESKTLKIRGNISYFLIF